MEKTNNTYVIDKNEEILKEIKGITVFHKMFRRLCFLHTGAGTLTGTGTKILDASLNLEIRVILIKKNTFSNPLL